MWRNKGRTFLVVAASLFSVALMAQPKMNSPLSRFGFGDLQRPEFVAPYTMGGIGSIYHHPYVTNLVNPASLGFLEATSFEAAVYGRVGWQKKAGVSQTAWSGNLDYLSLSIPLINPINDILEKRDRQLQGAVSLSLTPYSNVGYRVNSFGYIDSLGDVTNSFRGSGGTSRFNFATGWKYKNIAVGISVAYLFGNLEYQSETFFNDLGNNYEHLSRRNYSISGTLYDLGVMYIIPLAPGKGGRARSLTLGGHYNNTTRWKGKEDYVNLAVNPSNGDADTAVFLIDSPVKGKLPAQYGFGVMYEVKAKWSAGITYDFAAWDQYENSARPEDFTNTWKVSAGASITPDYSSITSYLARVEYRAGAFYLTDPRSLGGTQISQYGFTVGAGLPFVQQRYFAYLDVAVEFGWRGVIDNLTENYLRFKVGINLNDTQWFIKRRYN